MSQFIKRLGIRAPDTKTTGLLKAEFDPAFYLEKNPDVARAGRDPLDHYLEFGAAEFRNPNPAFSTEFYASQYADRIPDGMHPFVHYVRHGKAEGLSPNRTHATDTERRLVEPYFDRAFYLGQNPDVAESLQDPLAHFLVCGHSEGRDPSATFSLHWYRAQYMSEKPSSDNPFLHLVRHGQEAVYPAKLTLTEQELEKISNAFDADFYRTSYLAEKSSGIDPLRHFLTIGWLLGHDPNKSFSTTYYAKIYRHAIKTGLNPFVHYWTRGKRSGFSGYHHLSAGQDTPKVRSFFDRDFYLATYHDVRGMGHDPFQHYMVTGWKEGKDPNAHFSSIFYSRGYPDVAESGLHPLVHYARHGDARETRWSRPHLPIAPGIEHFSETQIAARQQDMGFPLPLETSKRIAVIVVPEHNEMSGGIFSIFSIANRLRKTKSQHGYDVVLMTNPNPTNHTYCRQTNFRNQEDIFRFEQIIYCKEAEEIYLHIPEYATEGFLSRCSEQALRYLLSRKKLYINILNQNIELMPEAKDYADLRRAADELTQSVAHHAYFSQEHADRYQVPTLLLPAYTDLKEYTPTQAAEKEDIIIYSFDDAWYKAEAIKKIRAAFPTYRMIEIRGITFDHYMDLATRCRFSISFGEGFDGYVAQPVYQGGIGFTVYREEFFPSKEFLQFPNFFSDPQALLDNLVPLMLSLSTDHAGHDLLNRSLVAEYDKLYSVSDYFEKIKKLAKREFEIFPSQPRGTA